MLQTSIIFIYELFLELPYFNNQEHFSPEFVVAFIVVIVVVSSFPFFGIYSKTSEKSGMETLRRIFIKIKFIGTITTLPTH